MSDATTKGRYPLRLNLCYSNKSKLCQTIPQRKLILVVMWSKAWVCGC